MAQALKNAPSKKEASIVKIEFGDTVEEVVEGSPEHLALSQEFDTDKKYVFELAAKNPVLEWPVMDARTNRPVPHKEFKPYQNLVMTSQIVWKGNRRMIRYYDGCSTIFVDKQPKEKELIEQFIKQTAQRNFENGSMLCEGYEKMLLLYCSICSWNAESPFRTKSANMVFVPVNAGAAALQESAKLDQTEEALKLAKEAKRNKMFIHANYLGIPTIDYVSGNELTEEEIRTSYRKEALRNSAAFIESYGNTAIEIKYFIEKALEKGIINNKLNPNKAAWGSSNSEICDISGLRSPEAIAQRLYEFSQSEQGEEFVIQLRAVSE